MKFLNLIWCWSIIVMRNPAKKAKVKPLFDPTEFGFYKTKRDGQDFYFMLGMVDYELYYGYYGESSCICWILKCTVYKEPNAVPNHSYNMVLADFNDIDKWGFIVKIDETLAQETYQPRTEVLRELGGYLTSFMRKKIIDELLPTL